jgi:predicted lipoprotein with Yx(FWY)xxD motif
MVKFVRGNSKRYHVRLIAFALVAVLGLLAAGVGVSSARSANSAAVKTRKVNGLGVVLVNAKGHTLYTFARDQRRHVTCTGKCARYWPPLKWKGSGKPKAGGAAKTKLLGLDANPTGGRVVTYNKWPLYTYAGDGAAGQANGQDISANGGKWYVITAGGKVIKHP